MSKVLAFVLMIAFLLVGCSQNEANSPSPTVKDNEAATDKPTITVPFVDFGVIPTSQGTGEQNFWTEWINENAPVQVEFMNIPVAQRIEKYNALFASGDAPDLIMTFGDEYINHLIDQKLVMPIDELIEKYSTEYKALMEKYPEIKKVATKSDGNMYQFTRVIGLKTNRIMVIRDDWLKKLGLEMPRTTEELYAVAEAFAKEDPDGNGKADTYGIGLSENSRNLINDIFGVTSYYETEGKLTRDDEPSRQALSFMKKLYDNNVVDKDFLTDVIGDKEKQDFLNGKLGITFINQGARAMGYDTFKTFKNNNPDGSYQTMPIPESPTGKHMIYLNPPFEMFVMVNSKAKNPEAVMKYIDFLIKDSTGITMSYGIKDKHWKLGENGCPQSLDSALYTEEVGWNRLYFEWLYPEMEFGPCRDFVSTLNPEDPMDEAFIQIANDAAEFYLNGDHKPSFLTYGNYMPQMPKELNQIGSTMNKTITDIRNKSIVSGASYTVDQALKDAEDIFVKSGGERILEFHNQWFTSEKQSDVFLKKDVYNFYTTKQKDLMKKPAVDF
ncbi:extracellular solute-binding protein family 1 [Paenibacillus algicola]|uniref:Extracellular solute-binding protein family 1 n=1 Tax=Paenibacillus algicola TaxID=2565926 RepID=A0A4P8XI43_9BACL|nr:extracellular solute-binding protein [Paenibacillus algicola]QCT02035.1 extracellular solute-binding protein family 1 [Paenibacillus algicola]